MNKDTIREDSSSQTVRSKYFCGESAMDESLSDFKEPKLNIAGPKNIKPKPVKPKRVPKRIRGQKDIRTALKAKKELECYAKDFENVCKQAGLDVDSEQLQLAIAISKSLQASTSSGSLETSQSLSTQDRVGKIRTTLLEYGFKVPEIKIKQTTTRRLKKRKNYKLLLTSDEAKQQIIADKYSQVLFQNISVTKLSQNTESDCHSHLHYLATDASYSLLKIIDTFYVNGLLEKSTSTGCLLRDWSEIPGRPVSPKTCERSTMNFSEIDFSQDELDIILSGSLKSCKNILCSKEKVVTKIKKREAVKDNLHNSFIYMIDDENSDKDETLKTEDPENPEVINQFRSCSPDLFDDEPSSVIENTDIVSQDKGFSHNSNHISDNYVVDSTETSKDKTVIDVHTSGLHLSQNTYTTRRFNDDMEITECIDVHLVTEKTVTPKHLQNITNRKSNDLMEITNCVKRPLQIVNDIDLTDSPENDNNTSMTVTHETDNDKNSVGVDEAVDNHLAENVVTSDTNFIENKNEGVDTKKSHDAVTPIVKTLLEVHNVDLTESPEFPKGNETPNQNIESLDLTQSSNTSDELPFVSLKSNKKSQPTDDTIIFDPKYYENILLQNGTAFKDTDEILDLTQCVPSEGQNQNSKEVQQEILFDLTQSKQIDKTNTQFQEQEDSNLGRSQNVNGKEILDLTQEVVMTSRNNSKTSENNVSFFEEYIHNHSDSYEVRDKNNCDHYFYNDSSSKEVGRDVDQGPSISTSEHNDNNDVDLTQHTDSSEDCSQDDKETSKADDSITLDTEEENSSEIIISKSSQRYSSLGKKGDVSIDYDDYGLVNENSRSKISSKSATQNSSQSRDISNCSQESEVFVISDNELDYSMHQSKLEMPQDNFIFGGISIMNDFFSAGSSLRKSVNTENNAALANKNQQNDDAVEEVTDKDNRDKTPVKHKRVNELATPQKTSCSGINVVLTPSNNEYVIDTNVTPKPDYESMTLFEIHKELDKFGVKPFKRKRAIQLLTHIYNETHPTIEPCEESPCKRRKTNDFDLPRNISPRKVTPRSPRKVTPRNVSPRKVNPKTASPQKTVKSQDAGKEQETAKAVVEKSKDDQRLNSIDVVRQNYENEVPVFKEVECNPEDWVFQKREKAKVHSCRVPLHVAFHNYISSRRELREAILCYEPINIDDIHKDLVAYGHRYDPKDLLKFMDKKCITVKTTDNDARNNRR